MEPRFTIEDGANVWKGKELYEAQKTWQLMKVFAGLGLLAWMAITWQVAVVVTGLVVARVLWKRRQGRKLLLGLLMTASLASTGCAAPMNSLATAMGFMPCPGQTVCPQRADKTIKKGSL